MRPRPAAVATLSATDGRYVASRLVPVNNRGVDMRGMGTVYRQKGSRFWWMQYWRDGVRHRESTHREKFKDARDVLKEKIMDVAQDQSATIASGELTVARLYADLEHDYVVNRRSSRRALAARWKHLKPFFGMLAARDVKPAHVKRYVGDRLVEHASHGTINRELAALKRMYKLAVLSGEIFRVPPIRMLKEDNVRQGFVKDSEYEALARATSSAGLWLRAMFEVAYTYGWRRGELTSRRVRHVDLAQRTLRLEPGETKNGRGRVVEMTLKVYELLEQCAAGKSADDYLFTREKDRRGRRSKIRGRIVDFRGDWEAVTKAAGVPGLRFHDLRRSGVTNMIRDGVSEKQAMTISGHQTRAVFDRYHIVDPAQLKVISRKMEAGARERIRAAGQRALLFANDDDGHRKPPESELSDGQRTVIAEISGRPN